MECPICQETIENACVGAACMHHFCYPCLFQWCAKNAIEGNPTAGCPVCRKSIFDIRFDREFDMLLHGNNVQPFKHPNETIIQFIKGTKAGVTLQNNQGPGVEVMSINEKDQFYKAGIRKGIIILFINNIPCNNHKYAIEIINYATFSCTPLQINTLTEISVNLTSETRYRSISE